MIARTTSMGPMWELYGFDNDYEYSQMRNRIYELIWNKNDSLRCQYQQSYSWDWFV